MSTLLETQAVATLLTTLTRSEAMLLGKSLGLSSELLATVINTSVSFTLFSQDRRLPLTPCGTEQTGRCWSSETNNPAPKATPTIPTPADRGYTGGFLSKLMSKGSSLSVLVSAPLSTNPS